MTLQKNPTSPIYSLVTRGVWIVGLIFLSTSAFSQSTFSFLKEGFSTDLFHGACEAENGDVVISGMSRSMDPNGFQVVYAVRLSSEGELIWEHTYGGDNDEFQARVVPRLGGGFLIVGTTFSYGAGIDDLYLIAIDDQGEVEWEKTIGDSVNQSIRDLIALPDGGFAMVGQWLRDSSVLGEVFFLRLDQNGNQVAMNFYGGTYNDLGMCLIQVPGKGFMLGGILTLFNPDPFFYELRMLLVGVDDYGTIQWTYALEHPTDPSSNAGRAHDIIMLSDSTYLFLGDMAVHLDREGNILDIDPNITADDAVAKGNLEYLAVDGGRLRYYQGLHQAPLWEEGYDITTDFVIPTQDGGYLIVGNKDLDMLALKVNCRGRMEADTPICEPPLVIPKLLIEYGPNPVQDELQIRVDGLPEEEKLEMELVDMAGRQIWPWQKLNNQNHIYSTEKLANGLYLLRFQLSGKGYPNKRLVVQH